MDDLDDLITVADVLKEASELPETQADNYKRSIAGDPGRLFKLGTFFERMRAGEAHFYILAAVDVHKFSLVNIESGARWGDPTPGGLILNNNTPCVSEQAMMAYLSTVNHVLYFDAWPILAPTLKFLNVQDRRITK